MNVNVEVIDTQSAILSVHKGCGNGSMIVLTPDGRGKIISDKTRDVSNTCNRSWRNQQDSILCMTEGPPCWTSDVNGGGYVNDGSRKFESDSGITFPFVRTEHWERVLREAQRDYERKQAIHQEVYGESESQGTAKAV